ncbi:MAG TPA: glycosyltransferase, partial [Acidimicrobiales bacterium]|nr:glycosyltransferase [Acidimicrobiales bacterium]
HFDDSTISHVPENTHVEPWVDQVDALAEAAAVVCHGGSGTVLGAIYSGRPVVVVPRFADQFENGRRIAEAGAGLTVDAGAPSERVTAALKEVLRDPLYGLAAARIGSEMRSAPTPAEVLDYLTR